MTSKPAKTGGDIRSFFGGPGSQPKPPPKANGSTQKQPIELDLSDEEESAVSTSAKTARSTLKRVSLAKAPPPLTTSMRPSPAKAQAPPKAAVEKAGKKALAAPSGKRKSIVIESSEDENDYQSSKPTKKAPRLSKASVASSSKKSRTRKDDDYDDDQRALETDDGDNFIDDDEEEKPKKNRKAPGKSRAAPKPKPAAEKDKLEKPTAKPEPPPKGKHTAVEKEEPTEKPKPKFNWAAKAAARAAGPANPGSKEIPEGQPNCLAGLTFVFTGELSSLAREEAAELVNRYGGRVTGSPSSKTSYVVLGTDAGPSKLATIKKHNLSTLDEDGFLDLIRTREGVLDEKAKAKLEQEKEAIVKAAKEMERRENDAEKENKTKAGAIGRPSPNSAQLWTTRYAPQTMNEICGNKTAVEKLQKWLAEWPKNLQEGFNKPGKDGMGVYRAVLISGPPGIGKTTSAHLVAKLEGYTPIEVNASDARSKKLVMNSTNVSNQSLDGWMHGSGEHTTVAGIDLSSRSVLIMDEVDGMSGSDRGGIGALNQLIKKTRIPIICIANDRTLQKMKPLQGTTYNLSFRKPDSKAIRSRIMSILFKEKMRIPANVVDQLVNGVQCDIRQVLNMLSTWKLSQDNMDFDEAKHLASLNEKYSTMTPWGVLEKLFGPYTFSATSRESLNDKIEYYFHDYSFVPLFVQENYVKTQPAWNKNMEGSMKDLKHLELLDASARSISDGDLVDTMIHGQQQHWSLMPLHAVTSTVYPASQIYGTGGHWGSANQYTFPAWLGQNSKMGALNRQLGDVQARMRSKVSGDKGEIRMTYIPMMTSRLVKPLIDTGSAAVDGVIHLMDEYLISKDEWDTIVEMGVGDNRGDDVLKRITTATKTNFTRKYNNTDHPIPFNRGQDIGASLTRGKTEKPDVEEAIEVDEEPEDEDEDAVPSGRRKKKDPTGIADDKLLKVSKGKAPAKPAKVKR
ncbi:DNA replication factor C, large subunit [Calocera viscosa TUFC12733]|uniref:Replication factor C subunit 1 n=1 Tax=Calocera viscosa (strain TUFC12733) TaxID=1330018 RepID=A0A167L3Y2_CALVF|nr:DNA replication factor C, large subunit [Calocera viscosa TUFC12733]